MYCKLYVPCALVGGSTSTASSAPKIGQYLARCIVADTAAGIHCSSEQQCNHSACICVCMRCDCLVAKGVYNCHGTEWLVWQWKMPKDNYCQQHAYPALLSACIVHLHCYSLLHAWLKTINEQRACYYDYAASSRCAVDVQ